MIVSPEREKAVNKQKRSTFPENLKQKFFPGTGLFIIIMVLMLPVPLSAHPHMFIDMKLKPVFSEGKFLGTWVNWLFDMVFTTSVLMDNGLKLGCPFTDEDVETIKNTAFANLLNYNYFTFFKTEEEITPARHFRDFTPFFSEKRLGYQFFLPYEGPAPEAEEIRIAVYDETFFCDIAFTEENPVEIESPQASEIRWKLSRGYDSPIEYDNRDQRVSREGKVYTGQTFPVELVLYKEP